MKFIRTKIPDIIICEPPVHGDERGYFKKGDTIAVKFCAIDQNVFKFVLESENQVSSTGSPFASPSNVTSNISNGALGIWAGYGATFDTLIAQ